MGYWSEVQIKLDEQETKKEEAISMGYDEDYLLSLLGNNWVEYVDFFYESDEYDYSIFENKATELEKKGIAHWQLEEKRGQFEF